MVYLVRGQETIINSERRESLLINLFQWKIQINIIVFGFT